MVLFESISVGGWRQFSDVTIPLHKECVILTGVNGSGKTTILNIIAKHFGWNLAFVATPLLGKRRTQRLYSDIYRGVFEIDEAIPADQFQVGEISYNNGTHCRLLTSRITGTNYQLNYNGIQGVEGLYIPSHRPAAIFTQVSQIPTEPIEISQIYQGYFSLLSQSMIAGHGRYQNPALKMKESLIALAVFGEDSRHVDANPQYAGLVDRFEEILAIVLPKELGFRGIRIKSPDIILETSTGNFSIDSMSGGVNALFSIAWQIFTFGVGKNQYYVTIDEPENHLHPTMQRSLLPKLVEAFPHVRFVVATHSPFIVSSYEGASIISLQRDEAGGIHSETLEGAEISGTPNNILRDILKVESNLPIWVEDEVRQLIHETANMPPEQRGDVMVARLAELGIGDAILEYREQGN